MDSVVQVVRGDSVNPEEGRDCFFCGKKSSQIFLVTQGKKYDGVLLKHFPICQEHFNKLNALLSGEYDIDRIKLEDYKKTDILRFR